MTGIPQFFQTELADQYAAENFRKLREFLVTETPFVGFRYYEMEFSKATTDFDFKHNLGFQPKDAIATFVSNNATLTWKYDSFTKDTVRLSVSAACTVRILIGAFS